MLSFIRSTQPSENEVEFRFKHINSLNFQILKSEFENDPNWKLDIQNDISLSGVSRISTDLPPEIRCVKGKSTVYHTKTRIQRPFDTRDFRISEAREEIVQGVNDSSFNFIYNVTHKRQRKRYSFTDGDHHFDLTEVYTGDLTIPSYEVELEILNLNYDKLQGIVNKVVSIVKKSLEIEKNYMDMIRTNRFVGPLPYTLTREKFDEGILSCGYSVTDKADGERYIMYFDGNGWGFIIDRNNKFNFCGFVSLQVKNSIIDGEMVNGVFYAFDILFHMNKDIREKDLVYRLKLLGSLTKKVKKVGENILDTKAFYMKLNGEFCRIKNGTIKKHSIIEGHIGTISKEIWNRRERIFKYNLDGLIFTPILKGYYNNSIMKWKPIDTIDFYIEKNGTNLWKFFIAGNDGDTYKNLPFSGIGNGKFVVKRGRVTETVQNKIYNDDTISESSRNGMFSVDVKHIDTFPDKSIIEFYYDTCTQSFVPIKVREDKKFSNNVSTINDIWESLKTPISINDISNSPYKMAIRPFHNKIKSHLIEKYMKNKSVLDIGFGAGGDIHKYSKARVKSVIGVDIVEPEYYIPPFVKFVKVDGDEYDICKILTDKGYQTTFDVINIQFAAHYFFRNDKVLNNFIQNLKKCLKVGGKIVMTILDGEKVMKKIESDGTSGFNGNQKIYDISLEGKSLHVKLNGTSYFNNFTSKEYLIDVNDFISKMKKNNFNLLEKSDFGSFKNTYSVYIDIMCESEKSYSFLNTILVFQKNLFD